MRSEARAARSEARGERRIAFACAFALLATASASAAPFSFDDIKYWVGSGSNRAALAIDWADNSSEPPSLVWGYRWNGTAHGSDMISAIVANDPRLFAKMGGSQSQPVNVYGLGYDANHNGQFGTSDDTSFDLRGFYFTSDPPDLATATDAGDYYAEGWFTGFWHYGVASSDPFEGGAWSDTGAGMASRTLADGAWDSWTFSPSFNFAAFAENPVAAEPPYPPGDFDHDGHVTAADYTVWRASFGSTSQPAADANGDSIVDAADFVIWRHAFNPPGSGNSTLATNVPEPSTLMFIVLVAFQVLIRRKPLVNANSR